MSEEEVEVKGKGGRADSESKLRFSDVVPDWNPCSGAWCGFHVKKK